MSHAYAWNHVRDTHNTHIFFCIQIRSPTHALPHACIYMYTHEHTHNACITSVSPPQENLDMIFSCDSCTLFPNAQHCTLFLQTMREWFLCCGKAMHEILFAIGSYFSQWLGETDFFPRVFGLLISTISLLRPSVDLDLLWVFTPSVAHRSPFLRIVTILGGQGSQHTQQPVLYFQLHLVPALRWSIRISKLVRAFRIQ